MELITPDFGLLFWMTLAFGIVFFVLAKFAVPVISGMLKKREEEINNALELAERTHKEMEQLHADNEALLQQARLLRFRSQSLDRVYSFCKDYILFQQVLQEFR